MTLLKDEKESGTSNWRQRTQSTRSDASQVQSQEGKKKKKIKKKQLAANLAASAGQAKAPTAKLVDDSTIDSADILIESNLVVEVSENVVPSTSSIKKPKRKEKTEIKKVETIAKKTKKDKTNKDSIKIAPMENRVEFDYNAVEKLVGSYDYFSKISL